MAAISAAVFLTTGRVRLPNSFSAKLCTRRRIGSHSSTMINGLSVSHTPSYRASSTSSFNFTSGALSTPNHARASISLDPSFRFHGGGPIDNLRPPSEICFFVRAVSDTAGPFLTLSTGVAVVVALVWAVPAVATEVALAVIVAVGWAVAAVATGVVALAVIVAVGWAVPAVAVAVGWGVPAIAAVAVATGVTVAA